MSSAVIEKIGPRSLIENKVYRNAKGEPLQDTVQDFMRKSELQRWDEKRRAILRTNWNVRYDHGTLHRFFCFIQPLNLPFEVSYNTRLMCLMTECEMTDEYKALLLKAVNDFEATLRDEFTVEELQTLAPVGFSPVSRSTKRLGRRRRRDGAERAFQRKMAR